ncbi:hypothetical protein HYH03_007977 [Edaphochlamys debaryana]|uniref:DNA topoisomerase (ATP-hydrolyzing) n=1 Tax=Edaphochlamys debaryana TaxID=47281 RepID=A0A835Y0Z2_9CHLO|nr:hypothetical protein HYH03_007977 [Edaphochlamys debaryana]|eukprot:KAG2493755.1 hypothetical protein HYH03_007977 [Edaphochlamys debaryana]
MDAASVLSRIESVAEGMLTDLAEGRVPVLQLARAARRSAEDSSRRPVVNDNGEEDIAEASYSLLGNQAKSALAYARVMVVLNTVHGLLRQGRQATQRDLYYTLLKPPLFRTVNDVNGAIAGAAAALRLPRWALGVTCAGRGAVAGRLRLREGPAAPWVDCSTAGPSGRALPGDLSSIARYGLQLTPGPPGPTFAALAAAAVAAACCTRRNAGAARDPEGGGEEGAWGDETEPGDDEDEEGGAHGGSGPGPGTAGGGGGGWRLPPGSVVLLVVEKDAVFQRLAEERVWEQLPCILVTARGLPDLATRAFVARLAAAFPPPRLIPLGLVDFNPAGVVILSTYKYGSDRLGPEGRAHTLPGLRWLGLRSCQLGEVEDEHLQRLTPRDQALIRSLRSRLGVAEPGWVAELDAMEAAGFKGDIEAIYHAGGGAGDAGGAAVEPGSRSYGDGGYGAVLDLVLRAVADGDVV